VRQYVNRRYTFLRIYKYGITGLHFVEHKIKIFYVTLVAKGFVSFNVQYSLGNIIRIIKSRRMRWVGHVARIGEKRKAYRLLVGKPEGKRPLGRPRRRWVKY
jgi:hypothetical protein